MIYTFRCRDCGDYDEFFKSGNTPKSDKCPSCGKTAKRVYVGTKFKMNGEFFSYQTGTTVKNKHEEEDQLTQMDEKDYKAYHGE